MIDLSPSTRREQLRTATILFITSLALAAVVACSLFLGGCTDDRGSTRALQSHGFSDITLTGWEPFGCSDSDQFSTGFRAKNAAGHPVSGVVCCGVLKSCTVRF